jgi:invasion protein IalB
MHVTTKRAAIAGSLLVAFFGAFFDPFLGAAVAQQPAPQPPPQQTPQRTTATYEDWIVRCEIQSGPPQQKICDMAQMAQVQGQANPISRVGIAKPAKGEAVKLVIQLPVNVTLASGVKLAADDKDPGLLAPFRRCVPAGCFAELDLKDDTMKKFRAATESWKTRLQDGTDHDVAIPLSFKGFGLAFDALLKQ